MEFSNLSFPEAVKKVADYYGIPIESDEEKRSNNIRRQSDRLKDSFCEEQLKASGLTVDDVMAKVATSRADEFELVPAFRKGSLNIAEMAPLMECPHLKHLAKDSLEF